MLATVKQQEVHLVINPVKGLLRGWTIITAVAPQPGQASIGLHSLGHTISSVTINGLPATFSLSPGPEPGLSEVTSSTTVKDVAEQAYFDYLSMVHRELLPDLVIQLPDGWLEHSPVAAAPPAAPSSTDKEKPGAKKQGKKSGGAQAGLTSATQDAAAAATPAAAAAAPDQAATQDDGGGGFTPAPASTTPPAAAPAATPTTPGSAAQPADGAPPAEEKLLIIRVAFSKPLNGTDSSAVMLVPGSDWCDSCESASTDGEAARYLVCDPQLRRTRALFPCAEVEGVVATYELHVTVPTDHVAVCDGLLKNQVVSYVATVEGYQVPHSRTFTFVSEVPVKASQVLLATGPLIALPITTATVAKAANPTASGKAGQKAAAQAAAQLNEIHTCSITCFGPPDRMDHVAFTVRPIQLIIKCFEKHLSHRFPYSQLHVVFLPAAAFRAKNPPVSVGTNTILMSTSMLVSPDACEQTVSTTLLLADCLARCVFGGLLMPLGPEDAWIHEGLAVYLSEVWAAQWLGKNELAWRRHKERQALAVSDSGSMPPLCTRTTERAGVQITPGQVSAAPLSTAQAYGSPFGTELLEPEQLRRWKSACVIRMCVQRAGEDQIKRILGGLVAKAGANTANPKFRFVATDKFLKWLSKQAGIKGNEAFAQRWIYGRGCPEFELGVVFRKNNTVDLALRQGGGAASRRAALLASRAAKETGVEDDLQSHVKVAIHEAENVGELHIKITPNDTILAATHELQTKVAGKRPGGRKPKGQQEVVQQVKEEGEEEGGPGGSKYPLLFVRFDPAADWICRSRVYQPEGSWVAQLDKSRDVVAQSVAVAGLASLAATMNQGAAGALAACLRSSETFCRVRAEAALALGLTVAAETAQSVLCGYLHDALYDPATLSLKPNSFSDMSEYVVQCAVVIAIGMLRGDNDKSPPEAMDMIVGFLDNCDNTGNMYSDAGYVACFIEAIGHMQPSTPAQLARLLDAIDRQLALEDLSPSPDFIIGAACLSALQRLAYQLTDFSQETRAGVKQTLLSYVARGVPLPLRHAAAKHLMAHAVACTSDEKGSALLTCLLDLQQQPGWGAAGRTALMMDAFNIMGRLLSERSIKPGEDPEVVQDIQEETAVGVELLAQLYRCLHATTDARHRHAVFMLLQRMTKQDPTLYREREEELVDPLAVVQPEATARSGGAAPTGPATTTPKNAPAMSGGTTGTVALTTGGTAAAAVAAVGGVRKFKVKVGGLGGAGGSGVAPAVSGGTVTTAPSGGQGGAVSQAPGSPTHTTSVMGPSSTFISPISHSRNVLQPIPEGEVHRTASGITAIAKPGLLPDDEVVQPVKAGAGLPRSSSAGTGLSSLAAGLPGASPPRDPRTRGNPAASSGAPTSSATVAGTSQGVPARTGTPPPSSGGAATGLAARSAAAAAGSTGGAARDVTRDRDITPTRPVRAGTPPVAPGSRSTPPPASRPASAGRAASPTPAALPQPAAGATERLDASTTKPAAPAHAVAAPSPSTAQTATPSSALASRTAAAPVHTASETVSKPPVPSINLPTSGGGVKPSPTPSPRTTTSPPVPSPSPRTATPPGGSGGADGSQGGASDGVAGTAAAAAGGKPARVPFGAGRRRSAAGSTPSSTSPVEGQAPAAQAHPPAAAAAAAASVQAPPAGATAAPQTGGPFAQGQPAARPTMRPSGAGLGGPAAGQVAEEAAAGNQPAVISPRTAAERKRSFDFPPLRPDAPPTAAAVAAAAVAVLPSVQPSVQPSQPSQAVNKLKIRGPKPSPGERPAMPPSAVPVAASGSAAGPGTGVGVGPSSGLPALPPAAPSAAGGAPRLKLKIGGFKGAAARDPAAAAAPTSAAVPAAGPPPQQPMAYSALPPLPAQPALPPRSSDPGATPAAAPGAAPGKIKFKFKGLGGGSGSAAPAPAAAPAAPPPGSEGASQPRKKPRNN